MTTLVNPAPEAVLSSLKWLAAAGGPFGPWFDRGVLAVIEQIERTGHYTPDPIGGLAGGGDPEQRAEAERLVRRRGWTIEEGTAFARGVRRAEAELAYYDGTRSG